MKTLIVTRAGLLMLAALVLTSLTSCGGGGGGKKSGGGGGLTPQQILGTLAAGGGGVTGPALVSGATLYVRVVEDATLEPMAGIPVVINDDTGAVLDTDVTDANGDVSFVAGATLPVSITIVDEEQAKAETFAASAQNPLRSYYCASVSRAPEFSVSLTGLTAGEDLVVYLNGVNVFEKDNIAASEAFNIDYASSDDAVLEKDEPWLLIANVYDNTSASVNRADLLASAYLYDSNGSEFGTARTSLTLNVTTGSGTSTGGVIAATNTIGQVTGTFTLPTLSSITQQFVAVALEGSVTNDFGTWPLVGSVATSGTARAYTVEYPILPAGVTGGAYTSMHRQGTAAIADILTQRGGGLVRRASTSALVNADIDMSTLPDIDLGTVFTSFTIDTVSGVALDSVNATMFGIIDNDTAAIGFSTITGTDVNFEMPVGTGGGPLTYTSAYSFLIDFINGGDGIEFAAGHNINTYPIPFATAIATSGDTGSAGSRVNVDAQLAGALTLNLTAPQEGAAFNVSNPMTWTATGLSTREGVFLADLDVTRAAGTSRWEFVVPLDAVSTAGGSSYSIRIPQLPAGAAFDAVRIDATIDAVAMSLDFLDVTEIGLNPNDFTVSQVDFDLDTTWIPEALANFPKVWTLQYPDILSFDPQ